MAVQAIDFNNMEPASHGKFQASHITVSDHARLQIGHSFTSYYHGDTSQLPPEQLQRLKEEAVLLSLAFPEMSVREASVQDTCEGTFEWIFEETGTKAHSTYHSYTETAHKPFLSWLSDHGGVFFISGKAGSGKSTLMRYIANHERIAGLLDL